MMGYYNNAEKTGETLDEEGWLHSGDLAIVDEVCIVPVLLSVDSDIFCIMKDYSIKLVTLVNHYKLLLTLLRVGTK